MVRAPKLSLHERGQIKALSTTGYTMKQIANIFERSRKIIMNFLRLPEEYGINKSSRRLGNTKTKDFALLSNKRATIHARKSTKTWLENNNVNVMYWFS
uniref:HTH_38 domain-containing protein n=1 Tax=Heterorhabditis bacteriophora TaxID=37862 RepID=A0A1I7WUS3_HETBA